MTTKRQTGRTDGVKGSRRARQAAEVKGHIAELVAAALLTVQGYGVIARRVRTPHGEIDLIACKAKTLVFIEVKARQSPEIALGAVSPQAQTRLWRAAAAWAAHRPQFAGFNQRFDVIAIVSGRWPTHVRDAFRPGPTAP